MRKHAIVAVLLVVSLVLATTVFREPIASAAQGVASTIISPLDGSGYVAVHEQGTANVAVTNFPATQRVSVANFPATQRVSVENFPAQQAAETVEISSGMLDGGNPWVEFDARPYGRVRIIAKMMNGTQACEGSTPIIVLCDNIQIARFTVSPGQDASELLEVPGTDVRVSSGHPACEFAYEIFGRTN